MMLIKVGLTNLAGWDECTNRDRAFLDLVVNRDTWKRAKWIFTIGIKKNKKLTLKKISS